MSVSKMMGVGSAFVAGFTAALFWAKAGVANAIARRAAANWSMAGCLALVAEATIIPGNKEAPGQGPPSNLYFILMLPALYYGFLQSSFSTAISSSPTCRTRR